MPSYAYPILFNQRKHLAQFIRSILPYTFYILVPFIITVSIQFIPLEIANRRLFGLQFMAMKNSFGEPMTHFLPCSVIVEVFFIYNPIWAAAIVYYLFHFTKIKFSLFFHLCGVWYTGFLAFNLAWKITWVVFRVSPTARISNFPIIPFSTSLPTKENKHSQNWTCSTPHFRILRMVLNHTGDFNTNRYSSLGRSQSIRILGNIWQNRCSIQLPLFLS